MYNLNQNNYLFSGIFIGSEATTTTVSPGIILCYIIHERGLCIVSYTIASTIDGLANIMLICSLSVKINYTIMSIS